MSLLVAEPGDHGEVDIGGHSGLSPALHGNAPDETEREPRRANDALDLDRCLQDRIHFRAREQPLLLDEPGAGASLLGQIIQPHRGQQHLRLSEGRRRVEPAQLGVLDCLQRGRTKLALLQPRSRKRRKVHAQGYDEPRPENR
jgi:hypothetical protein